LIRQTVVTVADLNEKELKKINKRRVEHKTSLLAEWPRTLLDALVPYKKPQLVNGKELASAIESKAIDLIQQPVYCGVFFMKAGR